jgi:hypothetical protein
LLQVSYLPACLLIRRCSCKNLQAAEFNKKFCTKIAASDQQNLWKKKVVLTPWTVFLI